MCGLHFWARLYTLEPPLAWDQCSSQTRFILHLTISVFLGPLIPGTTGVTLRIGSKKGIQCGALTMFRPGSQILRVCGDSRGYFGGYLRLGIYAGILG